MKPYSDLRMSLKLLRKFKYLIISIIRYLPISSELFGPIKFSEDNFVKWVKNNNSWGCTYQELLQGQLFHREVVVNTDYVDENVRKQFKTSEKIQYAVFFCSILKGRYIFRRIITPDDRVIKKLIKDTEVKTLLSSLFLPPIKRVAGDVFVLTNSTVGDTNYYHWMIETLPNLYPIIESGLGVDRFDYFIIEGMSSNFHIETLKLLGIQRHKIIDSSIYRHIKAERLFFNEYPVNENHSHRNFPEWTVDFLKNIFLKNQVEDNVNSTYSDKIYISRSNALTRKVINESDLINALNNLGFKSVQLETMSVVEQVKIFNEAKVIVSPHGAGLTNIVFCEPKAIVVEIFSPLFVWDCFYQIAAQNSLNYFQYIANSVSIEKDLDWQKNKCDNIHVDIENFIDFLILSLNSK